MTGGHGSLASINKTISDLGCLRTLIITDPDVRKAGLADLAKDALSSYCIGIYDRVAPDPTIESVDAATAYRVSLRLIVSSVSVVAVL